MLQAVLWWQRLQISIFQEPKGILAQMTPTREGPGALIRPPTPEKQPPPWLRLVLCQSKVLSGLSCWRLRSPSLKGNVSSAQNSLTKQVQLCSHWVMVDSLWPHGLSPTRLLCPWDTPGKDTGVCRHSLLQGIFLTQGSNLHLLVSSIGMRIPYQLSHQGSLREAPCCCCC